MGKIIFLQSGSNCMILFRGKEQLELK